MALCILCETDRPTGVCPIHGYVGRPETDDEPLSVAPVTVDTEQLIDEMVAAKSIPTLADLFKKAKDQGILIPSITIYGEGQGNKPTP